MRPSDEALRVLGDPAAAVRKVWKKAHVSGEAGPAMVLPYGECGTIRYDMPGDAVWLGTTGDLPAHS